MKFEINENVKEFIKKRLITSSDKLNGNYRFILKESPFKEEITDIINKYDISMRELVFLVKNDCVEIPKCPKCGGKPNFVLGKTFCSVKCQRNYIPFSNLIKQDVDTNSLHIKIPQNIIDYVKENMIFNGKTNYSAKDNLNEEVAQFILNYDLKLTSFINMIIAGYKELPRCKICGKLLRNFISSKSEYCSRKCLSIDRDIRIIQIKKYRKNNYNNFLTKLSQKNIEMISSYDEYYNYKTLYFKCNFCSTIFDNSSQNNRLSNIRCPKYINSPVSNVEKEVLNYIKTLYNGEIVENSKNIIHPKELDIYIPELNLAVEINGTYWHNSFRKGFLYHKEKTLDCYNKNIRLIHINEYDWIHKQEICKSIISSALCLNVINIDIIDCSFEEISLNLYKSFVETNDIVYTKTTNSYGFYYNNELVCVVGINNGVLSNICYKLYYNITNIEHILKEYSNIKLNMTYKNYFYSLNDFLVEGFTPPNYRWISKSNVIDSNNINDTSTLLENFDKNLSFVENMNAHYYNLIFDSGCIHYKKQT